MNSFSINFFPVFQNAAVGPGRISGADRHRHTVTQVTQFISNQIITINIENS